MWSSKVCLYLPNIAQKNNIFVTHYTYYPMKWPLIWTSSSENALFLGNLMTKSLLVKLLHWQTARKLQFIMSFIYIACSAQSPIHIISNEADHGLWIKEI